VAICVHLYRYIGIFLERKNIQTKICSGVVAPARAELYFSLEQSIPECNVPAEFLFLQLPAFSREEPVYLLPFRETVPLYKQIL
jgi:hypothetical protein